MTPNPHRASPRPPASLVSRRQPREPWFSPGPAGRYLVNVKVPSGEIVRIWAEDYAKLMADGVSDQWFLKGNGKGNFYVTAGVASLHVARLIVDAPPGQHVKYRDRNRANLCRDNLYLVTPEHEGRPIVDGGTHLPERAAEDAPSACDEG